MVANTQASALLPAGTFNSVAGPSVIIISVQADALMAPTENVAADANDGLEANTGTVSAREGINTFLEVSIISGVNGVSVSASVDAGMDQNNNSNDITTNNKYPKAQRRKHNNIAPAAVGPWAQPNCTTIRSMTTF